jgi:hypothetical protein
MTRSTGIVLALACAACAAGDARHPSASAPSASARCDAILNAYRNASPGSARLLGMHAYDGRVGDYSRAGIERRITAAKHDVAELDAIDRRALTPDGALDVDMLRWALQEELFNLEERALWKTDPAYYIELFAVNDYADREGAPVRVRLERLLKHEEAALREVPHIYENLRPPLSTPVAAVAADRFAGYATYLRDTVPARMLEGADAPTRARFDKANGALAAEATRLTNWLKKDVVPHGDNSHVLGRARFEKLVALYAGKPIPLATFKAMGEADLAKNRAAYDALEKNPKPRRPNEAEYLEAASRITEDARAFVLEHGLVTLASNERVVVRETPPYMRYNQGWTETYGPFETENRQSFYDITLPDPSWPADKREGYISGYGDLRVSAAHEVYPGHCTQIRMLDHAPTRVQKSLISFTFHEGWGHYVEQMMVDEGFGKEDPETRQAQLEEALLRDCRVIVAVGMHSEGMSVADGEERFVHACAQERAVAHEQALRAAFHPWYFAYTLGKLQILELREEARAKLGVRFSLRRFHDALLSHGEPPVSLLRDRVLSDLGAR